MFFDRKCWQKITHFCHSPQEARTKYSYHQHLTSHLITSFHPPSTPPVFSRNALRNSSWAGTIHPEQFKLDWEVVKSIPISRQMS